MFEIGLSGFRVFETTQNVQVRPLTIVTGGNSSGKTSFLAAVRMLSDLAGWGGSPASFNKEPFFLGSFDQISHHRGGRYGRLKSFTLSLSGNPKNSRTPYFVHNKDGLPDSASISISYKNHMGQPAISCLLYKADGVSIDLNFSDSWKSATLNVLFKGESKSTTMTSDKLAPPEMMASQSVFITSAVEQLLFKMNEDDGRSSPTSSRPSLELSYHIRSAFGMMPTMGFAGGPVRTRPLRTYDPTDATTQSEGAHVPSRMAQLARTHPAEWVRTKGEIDKFGRSSGLFKEIEVRRLGKGDSDPFQINVSINGPRRNIVDVGYGVSQAVPIIFELATRQDDDLYMLQQPEVHLHPQAQAALGSYIVSNLTDAPGTVIVETHSDYMIDRVRRHIRDGDISPSDVSLLYFERGDFSSQIFHLEINENGEIVNPPPSYREFFLNEQIENLSL